MQRLAIGIDPGVNTGFAVWDKTVKKFIAIRTLDFWKTASELMHLADLQEQGEIEVEIVIEDVTQNKPTFNKGITSENENQQIRKYQKISQNVGENKKECKLLMELCEIKGLKLIKHRPNKSSMTKLSAEAFENITGYKDRTSQHGRDCAMLVFGK